jgi:methylenetetrahydrofolate dehydrogenase (NADP+)/methenyltetrahydrofolate cyclohydrolase
MIISGRAIADDVYAELAPKFSALGKSVKLGIVVVGENAVIESFVRMKGRAADRLGVEMVRVSLPETATTEKVVEAVHALARETDAVILQLPLPKHVDINIALAAVSKEKDVDALNPTIFEGDRIVHAPVALAVVEILQKSGIAIAGARTVVIGAGRLVGAPSAWLLKSLGARVSMFTLQQGSINDLKDADIVVSGAGNPGFIKPEHLKQGVALVDAGTSELKKKIRGDADPACAEKASVFTPVPGGVGPVAVAMIFRNLLDLIENNRAV